MSIKPLHDRVVIQRIEEELMSAGGIVLPDTAKEKPQQGVVVAVGPGKVSDTGTLVPMSVKEGDKILYGKYSGTEVNVAGTDYIIMRESDILAIM